LRGLSAATGAQPTIALDGQQSLDEERLSMKTDTLHRQMLRRYRERRRVHANRQAVDAFRLSRRRVTPAWLIARP
jgi:hypothetical protein